MPQSRHAQRGRSDGRVGVPPAGGRGSPGTARYWRGGIRGRGGMAAVGGRPGRPCRGSGTVLRARLVLRGAGGALLSRLRGGPPRTAQAVRVPRAGPPVHRSRLSRLPHRTHPRGARSENVRPTGRRDAPPGRAGRRCGARAAGVLPERSGSHRDRDPGARAGESHGARREPSGLAEGSPGARTGREASPVVVQGGRCGVAARRRGCRGGRRRAGDPSRRPRIR